ncbi:hypothetical protein KFE25_005554 [Diacronema lutheri]|uniref:RWD domain-containing protein n=1 Tax=Diacronema lutheri TaxID=2081491 RepID=A0A8J6CAX9_DIALT|nr:hypothetical protein KFE25_005554 [Diacronema lutheri]
MEDDGARRREEAEALASIYPADEFWCSDDGLVWTAVICREPRAELHLHLPLTYPSSEPPAVVIDAPSLRPTSVSRLAEELAVLQSQSVSLEIGFAWIQHAAQFVAAELEASELEASIKAAADAASPLPSSGTLSSQLTAEATYAPPAACAGCAALAELPPVIFSGEPLTDRKSTFQAHVARCASTADVRAALRHLLADRKIARATHNQFAWRLWDATRGAQLHDNDDDGESGAGSKLAELLELMGANGVLVVVSRWYGGILLGADRFKHIVATARDAIERAGLMEQPAGAHNARPAAAGGADGARSPTRSAGSAKRRARHR